MVTRAVGLGVAAAIAVGGSAGLGVTPAQAADPVVVLKGDFWPGGTVLVDTTSGFPPSTYTVVWVIINPNTMEPTGQAGVGLSLTIPTSVPVGLPMAVIIQAPTGSGGVTNVARKDFVIAQPPSLTTGPLQITGNKWADQQVTAAVTANSFSPAAQSVTFEWYSGTGTSGTLLSTDASLAIPAKAAVGSKYTVVATGKLAGYADTPLSATITTVTGTLSAGNLTIEGLGYPGTGLGLQLSSQVTPAADSTTITWIIRLPSGGASSTTGGPVFPIPADAGAIGTQVSTSVVWTKEGYDNLSKTAGPKDIVQGSYTGGKVSVSGEASVGNQLTASLSEMTPTPTAVSYRWYRGSNASGTLVSEAASYTVPSGTATGTTYYVEATGGAPGFTSRTVSTTLTTKAGTLSGGSLSVSGTKQVGQTLTASLSATSPASSVSYAWYAGTATSGTALSSAATYTIGDAVAVGTQYTVVATAT
ncbi:MAG: hypothetical protein LBK59_11970, partial [Bifidobacteriaceae bacterium]|nr:hypothetical protein [Bifidobacteriaceae bacterium]